MLKLESGDHVPSESKPAKRAAELPKPRPVGSGTKNNLANQSCVSGLNAIAACIFIPLTESLPFEIDAVEIITKRIQEPLMADTVTHGFDAEYLLEMAK